MYPLYPTAWMWSLLAIPIVGLYILKVRLRRLPVATLLFWEQLYEESAPRSLWRKLRQPLSLMLQLLLLFLLVTALSDPQWAGDAGQARRLIVIVDHSASMNAGSDGPTRLELAKSHALKLVRGLRVQDEMAVISAGSASKVRTGLTGHQRTLRAAIEGIEATDTAADLAAALETAQRLHADHPHGQVVLLTDNSRRQHAELADGFAGLVWKQLGELENNLAITQFQVRRSLNDPLSFDMQIEVANYTEQPQECELALYFVEADRELESLVDVSEADTLDAIPLTLKPGETWSTIRSATSQPGGRVLCRLRPDDALDCDNLAVARLPDRKLQRVLLVAERGWFLPRAFEAVPLVELQVVSSLPQDIPADSLIVFHRRVPTQLPEGNILIVDPQNDTALWKLGPALAEPLVVHQEPDHPLLRHVQFENVNADGARKMNLVATPSSPAQVLVKTASDDPVLVAWRSAERRVVTLTAALEKGDLALRTSFPILIANVLNWMQGDQHGWHRAVNAGEPLTRVAADGAATLPASVAGSRMEWISQTGKEKWTRANGDNAVGSLDRCGLWRFRPDGESTAGWEVACNLANASESDLRVEKQVADSAEAAQPSSLGWPLWIYLALAGLGLAVGEWCLYQRRVVG